MNNVEGIGDNSFFKTNLILQVDARITLVKIKIKIILQTGLLVTYIQVNRTSLY